MNDNIFPDYQEDRNNTLSPVSKTSNQRQAAKTVLIALLLVLLAVGGIYAVVTEQVAARTKIAIDASEVVDITLAAQPLASSQMTAFEDKTWNLKIENPGEKCWVRTKTAQVSSTPGVSVKSEPADKSNWQQASDGWWYLKTPVLTGESKNIGVNVRPPLPEDGENGTYTVKVTATVEAMQEEGFSPDFTSTSPWKGISAQASAQKELEVCGE